MGERDPMTGNIAVGVIIVDGKAGTEASFSFPEMMSIVIEVGEAFAILYSLVDKVQPPRPKVLFEAHYLVPKLDLDPSGLQQPTGKATRTEAAKLEPVWLNPALVQLGFPSGAAGIKKLQQSLKDREYSLFKKPEFVVTAFFTKYPCYWCGYAKPASNMIVIQYDWLVSETEFKATGVDPNWGVSNIDRVFAHELGHVFGAPDEYFNKDNPCKKTSKHGKFQHPNLNCETKEGSPASVDCIMKGNTPVMCSSTPIHFGWFDVFD